MVKFNSPANFPFDELTEWLDWKHVTAVAVPPSLLVCHCFSPPCVSVCLSLCDVSAGVGVDTPCQSSSAPGLLLTCLPLLISFPSLHLLFISSSHLQCIYSLDPRLLLAKLSFNPRDAHFRLLLLLHSLCCSACIANPFLLRP